MSGGGGVVRNNKGDIIVGNARSYGMGTNNCTECASWTKFVNSNGD